MGQGWSHNLTVVVYAILSFIAIGTTIVFGIFLSNRDRHRDMLYRTLSWYPVSLFVLGGMFVGREVFTCGFVWVSLQVFRELTASDARLSRTRALPAVAGLAVFQYSAMLFGFGWASLLVVPCAMVLHGCVWLLTPGKGDRSTLRAYIATVVFSVWIVGMLPLVAWLPLDFGEHGWGGGLLFMLIITQFNDVFQYIWGKLLGRRKLAERISPKKTWEGVLGGAVTMTVVGALLGGYIAPFGAPLGAALAAVLCVGGVSGDLAFSLLKRARGIKDFGDLLPGFGGVLDRIDSLAFNAPIYLLAICLFELSRALVP